jgi:hypothetical protein
MGSTGDQYVSGGVNWAAFSLEELVDMVSDKASVPQLERLADDWRQTGEGVVVAADHLAEALDDLMNFWSGATADQARQTVALNAQWVGDLGVTATNMGDPIEEAAGALKAAQDAMPELPPELARVLPGSAPRGAHEASLATDGSSLGAALGATAAGAESAFRSQAELDELKRIAIEAMERFEAAALGIDQATPRFQGRSTELRIPDDVEVTPGDDLWHEQVERAPDVDSRWPLLTGMTETSAAAQRGGSFDRDGFDGGSGGGTFSGGGGGVLGGPSAGGGALGAVADRAGGVPVGRGAPVAAAGAVPPVGSPNPAVAGPMGGAPMAGAGMGGQGDGQAHRRRVPYDEENPFDSGQQVSKPVIGI